MVERGKLSEGLEGRCVPGAAGFSGGDDVVVVVAAEDVALRGEVLDAEGREGGAGKG